MTRDPIDRWTSIALIGAGVSLAAWSGGHPWGQLAGAHVGVSAGWRIAHTSHFLAGMLLLFALLGLFARRQPLFRSAFGATSLVVAFAGTAMFMAGGVFTAFIWPVLAHNTPAVVAAEGPFFSPPDRLLFVTTLMFAVGLVLLGTVLHRAGLISPVARVLLTVGPVLLMAAPPPLGPAPWILFALSGVVTGTGLASAGFQLRRAPGATAVAEPALR